MAALLLNPPITALEKRARLDFVIVRADKSALDEALVPRPARKNPEKRKSILDPALFDIAKRTPSLREWGINE